MHSLFRKIFGVTILLVCSYAQSELDIEINEGAFGERSRIAVVPFDWKGNGIAPTAFD